MRILLAPLALACFFTGEQSTLAAAPASTDPSQASMGAAEESESETAVPGDADLAPASGARASKADKSSRHAHRRGGKAGNRSSAKVVGWVVTDDKLRPTPLPSPSGNLSLDNLSNHETLKVNIYNEDGSYNVQSLKAVTHILRCKRTDSEKDIDPRLMTVLSHIYDHYQRPIEIVSGYRNQRKQTSFHYRASASDIRIPGVPPKKLRNFVDTLDAGGLGVGLYPRSLFVHVDVRPLPSYRWIDYAKSNPDSPDKRPPRNWKRKKRVS